MNDRLGNKKRHGFFLCRQIRKLWRWLCNGTCRCPQKRQSNTHRTLILLCLEYRPSATSIHDFPKTGTRICWHVSTDWPSSRKPCNGFSQYRNVHGFDQQPEYASSAYPQRYGRIRLYDQREQTECIQIPAGGVQREIFGAVHIEDTRTEFDKGL